MRYKIHSEHVSSFAPRIGFKVFEIIKDDTDTIRILTGSELLRTPMVKHKQAKGDRWFEISMVKNGVYHAACEQEAVIKLLHLNSLAKSKLRSNRYHQRPSERFFGFWGKVFGENMDTTCGTFLSESYKPGFHVFLSIVDAYQYMRKLRRITDGDRIYSIYKVNYYGEITELVDDSVPVDSAEYIKIREEVDISQNNISK